MTQVSFGFTDRVSCLIGPRRLVAAFVAFAFSLGFLGVAPTRASERSTWSQRPTVLAPVADRGVTLGSRQIDVETAPTGEVWLFSLDAAGTLHGQHKMPGEDWSTWTQHGSAASWATIDVEIGPAGEVWVFGLKLDGTLYGRVKLPGAAWSTWTQHGRAGSWATMEAEVGPTGEVWVFGMKLDGTLYGHAKDPGAAWSPWVRHGQPSSWLPPIGLAIGPSGEVWLFASKRDWLGKLLVLGQEKPAAEPWSAWTRVHRDPDRLEQFKDLDAAVSSTGQVWLLHRIDWFGTTPYWNVKVRSGGSWDLRAFGYGDAEMVVGPSGEVLTLALVSDELSVHDISPTDGLTHSMSSNGGWVAADIALTSSDSAWVFAVGADGSMSETSIQVGGWSEHEAPVPTP